MFVPEAFRIADLDRLHGFVERYDFATLVSPGEDGMAASHVPLLLERGSGPRGTLVGHLSRANPQWRGFDGEREALAIFHGPHAYVSPAWYANAPAVPTWNYAVVHAQGRPVRIDDAARIRALLERSIALQEAHRDEPWRPDLPEEFRARMEKGIVAFELPIERIEGKFKLGQNRPPEDREGTVRGLEREGSTAARELADFTRRALDDPHRRET